MKNFVFLAFFSSLFFCGILHKDWKNNNKEQEKVDAISKATKSRSKSKLTT